MESAHHHVTRNRFSVFDWILLAILVPMLSLIVWLCVGRESVRVESLEIRYVLFIEDLPSDIAAAWREIPKDSAVTNGSGTATLGRVVTVEVTPSEIPSVVGDKIVMIESTERFNATVTVIGQGSDGGADGLRILSHRIAAECTGSFRIGGCYAANARIIWAEYGE